MPGRDEADALAPGEVRIEVGPAAPPQQQQLGRLSFQLSQHLCSFLDARGLTALHEAASSGRTATRDLVAAAESRAVWAVRLREDHGGAEALPPAGSVRSAKDAYLEARARRVAEREAERRAHMRAMQHLARQRVYSKFSACFHAYQECLVPCCSFPLLIAGLVLVAWRLDQGEAVTLSDVSPFLACVGLLVLGCACVCAAARAPPAPFADDTLDESEGPLKGLFGVYKLAGDSVPARAAMTAALLLLPLQAVLLCLRAAGALGASPSWGLTMLPWWLFSAAVAAAPLLPEMDMPKAMYCHTYVFMFGLPFVIGPAMLAAYLDGAPESLSSAMIPGWIFLGFCLLAALAALCEDPGAGLAGLAAWICLGGPVLAFQVMLVVFVGDDEATPGLGWMRVVSPLLALLGMFACAGFGLGASLIDDRLE